LQQLVTGAVLPAYSIPKQLATACNILLQEQSHQFVTAAGSLQQRTTACIRMVPLSAACNSLQEQQFHQFAASYSKLQGSLQELTTIYKAYADCYILQQLTGAYSILQQLAVAAACSRSSLQ
jgi:hypothetical protein